MLAVKAVADRDGVSERIVRAMRLRADARYDLRSDTLLLRLSWNAPDDVRCSRSCQLAFATDMPDDEDYIKREILNMVDNLNLRGELFFMRLHRHFPNRIDKVTSTREGQITVRFKNGRELVTDEQHIDSVEFLATCGMVYDL